MTGTGDADLYVRRSSQPTSALYDFRPYLGGSAESVTVNASSTPALVPNSTYYVSVYGYDAGTSTFTVTATVGGAPTATPTPTPTPTPTATPTPTPTPTTTTLLTVPSTAIAKSAWLQYTVTVPAGSKKLEVIMTGSGDADLYVRKAGAPTTSLWDYRPYGGTTAETVTVLPTSTPVALSSGTWYIGVNGYATTSTFALSVKSTN